MSRVSITVDGQIWEVTNTKVIRRVSLGLRLTGSNTIITTNIQKDLPHVPMDLALLLDAIANDEEAKESKK